jgi:TPR repeat protein
LFNGAQYKLATIYHSGRGVEVDDVKARYWYTKAAKLGLAPAQLALGKLSYYNLPLDIGFTLFTPIKGRIGSLTVYIYKAETCTHILRYNIYVIFFLSGALR